MSDHSGKILLIKHGAFGDLIQSDGILRDIRACFSEAEIVLLTNPAFKSLMERCPHIDRIICDPRAPLWRLPSQFELIRTLQREKFGRVVDLQNSDRTRLYRKLLFSKTPWTGRLSGPEPASGLRGLVDLLKHANIPVAHSLQPDVSWMAEDCSGLLSRAGVRLPFVALIPGSSAKHPQKRWPYYAELAQSLIETGYDVVNLIGPEEANLAHIMPGHNLADQHGLLSWFELAGILQQACFVIGNDTGPSHVASCLGRPGLALFGQYSCPNRAEIRRGMFRTIQVGDLRFLSVDTVLAEVLSKLPAPNRLRARPAQQPSY
jgi:ADP-heptose:LPS heptosyltransferase